MAKGVYFDGSIKELYLDAYWSANEQKHLQQVKDLLSRCTVSEADQVTEENYGIVKSRLLKKGKPIAENDIWIAATALQHEVPVKL